MKKYFGLSDTQESVLGWVVFVEQLTDTSGLLALIGSLFNAFFKDPKKFSLAVWWDLINGFDNEGNSGTYSVVSASVLSVWAIIKTIAFFIRWYLESKVVADYADTEEVERR